MDPLRRYLGNGFTVDIPAPWVDLSVYSFAGVPDGDAVPMVNIQFDLKPGTDDVERFAAPRLRRSLEAASNARLARRERVRVGRASALLAEIRWHTPAGDKRFQRLLYLVEAGCGYTLSAALDKRLRLTRGAGVDAVIGSFRARDPRQARSAGSTGAIETERFALTLAPGWTDQTVVLLAEPDAKRFRRTLVIARDTLAEPPVDDAAWMNEEITVLKQSVPGFELLDHKETVARDGGSAQRVAYRRTEKNGDVMLQTQLFAWREGVRYVLVLTTEAEPPRAIVEGVMPMLRSFSAAGAAVAEAR